MITRHELDHVDVGDVQIAFRVEGRERAHPLVLVNSLGTDMHMWDAQVSSLGAHFQVVRYDSELDESTPAWQGEELHDAIAGSELALIRGAAHLSNVVRPAEFTNLVTRFLGAA